MTDSHPANLQRGLRDLTIALVLGATASLAAAPALALRKSVV